MGGGAHLLRPRFLRTERWPVHVQVAQALAWPINIQSIIYTSRFARVILAQGPRCPGRVVTEFCRPKHMLGGFGLLSLRIMVMECGETDHVLQTVPKAHPDQACSLQGSDVSCDILAANDLGTGSGWQQSRQNWALIAVVGTWA